jgi:hypothetical protein
VSLAKRATGDKKYKGRGGVTAWEVERFAYCLGIPHEYAIPARDIKAFH